MTRYHPNSINLTNKTMTEREVTPYHVMAYHINIDPDENMAIPPQSCPRRDANMVIITSVINKCNGQINATESLIGGPRLLGCLMINLSRA